MAWASAEILCADEAEARLAGHGGAIYRPTKSGKGTLMDCPRRGSLQSLIARHKAMGRRLREHKVKRTKKVLFTQPPRPRFDQVAYDSPPVRRLFELRPLGAGTSLQAWPLSKTVPLVEAVRDQAAARLRHALPAKAAIVDRVFIGRHATEADKASRIRIIPLPSIGHPQAESSIRRVLLEIPPDCPLRWDDVAWAFAGLHLGSDPETGEVFDESLPILISADDWWMPGHYGIDGGDEFRVWRSVTPVALPGAAARRRIDPARRHAEAKGAEERAKEERRAAGAVCQALRHAGIEAPVAGIHVQREPFAAKGARAETFAPGTRFAKERLSHVEIAFSARQSGPVVIGDGRYLGLGLMAPVRGVLRDLMVFALVPDPPVTMSDSQVFLGAVRRALMALSSDDNGSVSRLFSGHEPDGRPARSDHHEHILLAAHDADRDGRIDRLVVAAPWICDRTVRPCQDDRIQFDRIVSALRFVRAGRLGVIRLGPPSELAQADPLIGPARHWRSETPYRSPRQAGRGKDPAAVVTRALLRECARRGLPRPSVTVHTHECGPRGGNLTSRLDLSFAVPVQGPLLLGQDSHRGGGLFTVVE